MIESDSGNRVPVGNNMERTAGSDDASRKEALVRGPRFPGFSVLKQVDVWDNITKGVVLRRLGPPPKLRFFNVDEEAICRSLLEQLLALYTEPLVSVFEHIDARLAENQTDGWHYDNMPEDREAWRRSIAALDEESRAQYQRGFAEISVAQQRELLEQIRTSDNLRDMPAPRVWSLWMRYACTAFYAHPLAWNEIGFGGPAYPRGYKNLGLNRREPWEVQEVDARNPVPWAARAEKAWIKSGIPRRRSGR